MDRIDLSLSDRALLRQLQVAYNDRGQGDRAYLLPSSRLPSSDSELVPGSCEWCERVANDLCARLRPMLSREGNGHEVFAEIAETWNEAQTAMRDYDLAEGRGRVRTVGPIGPTNRSQQFADLGNGDGSRPNLSELLRMNL